MKLRSIGIGAAVFAVVFALLLCGCSNSASTQSASEGPDYADDEAMTIIAKGLEARWAIIDATSYEDNAENLKKAVNAELEIDKPLRDRQFEDAKMQGDVLNYINTLEDSLEVLEKYPYQSSDYYDKWDSVYNTRTSQLKNLVDKYDLTVSENKQSTLDELLTAGTAAQNKTERDDAINGLFEKATFEKTDQGYGYYEYTATIENTTDFSFKDVGIVLALYDSEGVRAGETYTSIKSWDKGEKARFEAGSDIDAEKVKASVDYYAVSE
ncbi:MAG: FxLYD domain-containing protein [Acidobacteriota bacterium]|nr:FxLYD domain-containing protein [Acidobacteriota bacterium]